MEYVLVIVAVWLGQWVMARFAGAATPLPTPPCKCDCKASALPAPLCAPVDLSGVHKKLDALAAAVREQPPVIVAPPVVEVPAPPPAPPQDLAAVTSQIIELRTAINALVRQKQEVERVAAKVLPFVPKAPRERKGARIIQARIEARRAAARRHANPERRNG
jgi:hypothetical protein